jgi:hypothetical protein
VQQWVGGRLDEHRPREPNHLSVERQPLAGIGLERVPITRHFLHLAQDGAQDAVDEALEMCLWQQTDRARHGRERRNAVEVEHLIERQTQALDDARLELREGHARVARDHRIERQTMPQHTVGELGQEAPIALVELYLRVERIDQVDRVHAALPLAHAAQDVQRLVPDVQRLPG